MPGQEAEAAAAVPSRLISSGGPTADSPGQRDGTPAQLDEPIPRRRGGQPQNTNALKHGRRSRRAEQQRAGTAATMKLARHLLAQLGTLQGRCRPRPVRLRQLPHLDAEGRRLLDELGVPVV
jgi:hypothetical protein